MKKNFILDTNVLLYDPRALFAFQDNHILVPITVIQEIDRFKRELSETGRNAREVARHLDELRELGHLGDGVPLESGGTLTVVLTPHTLPPELLSDGGKGNSDDRILAVALETRNSDPRVPAIFITKDTNLRIRADAMGIDARDYTVERLEVSELYTGISERTAPPGDIDRFYSEGGLALEIEPSPNEFVVLKDAANPNHSAVGRWDAGRGRVAPLIKISKEGIWGVRPRNKEQAFAIDLLLNDDVKLVTLSGKAGTGKTLLAIAAGLHKTLEEGVYSKLLVSRPIFPLGRDIGYLPGDVEEKLNPWMQPIFDNVEFLLGLSRSDKKAGRGYHELIDLGVLAIEPLTYIRGRSIPHQFIIVDESQNLTPHEVKTIVTRVGEGTKVVLTGDPYQIDHPYVDATNNGLKHVVHRMRREAVAGHVTLSKGERSPLAEQAANLL